MDGFLHHNSAKHQPDLKDILLNSSQNFVARESFELSSFGNLLKVDYFRSVMSPMTKSTMGQERYKTNALMDTLASKLKLFTNQICKSIDSKDSYFVCCFDPRISQSNSSGEIIKEQMWPCFKHFLSFDGRTELWFLWFFEMQ